MTYLSLKVGANYLSFCMTEQYKENFQVRACVQSFIVTDCKMRSLAMEKNGK